MSANNLQTNRNATRYFFATSENGEQTLGLQYGTTGGTPNLSTMAVTISGGGGNGVIVNTAPSYQATDYIFAEQGMGVYGSTYFTPSTLTASVTGINLTSDRTGGTGIACIESYAGNGSVGGFEFLSRGVDSALVSTPIDAYFSALGSPGAVAKVGQTGQLVAGQGVVAPVEVALSKPDTGVSGVGAFTISDLSGGSALSRWSFYKYGVTSGANVGSDLALGAYSDNGTFIASCLTARRATGQIATINNYTYPQAVVSVPPSTLSPGAVSVPNASPTSVLSITGASSLIAGANYMTDINFTFSATNATANAVWLQFGVRLGGNGAFNYENPIYLPVGGTGLNLSMSLNQISDMGSATPGLIEIIAYQQNIATGTISVTATTSSSSPPHLLKMIT